MSDTLSSSFELLASESEDLYVPAKIQEINYIPTPIEFLRNYVNSNVPVLMKGGASDWPALKKWDQLYLKGLLGDKKVTVAVTPNGYADAIAYRGQENAKEKVFVLPEDRTITLKDLFNKLNGGDDFEDESIGNSKGIFYLQKQDSNLTTEFSELLPDIEGKLDWASEAFGAEPNATNLWIGDAKSVTSLHKDPFENIYCVVAGWKDFILLPPTDRPWIPYAMVPVTQYRETSPGEFVIEDKPQDQGDLIPWIDIDPVAPDQTQYPEFSRAHRLHVRVDAGDLLYLPSLWFHHVRQSDGCIAVNFWYDMAMDVKFVYYQFLEQLARSRESSSPVAS